MDNVEKQAKDFAKNVADKGADKVREFGSKAKEGAESLADKAERATDKLDSSSLQSAGKEAQKCFTQAKDEVAHYAEDLYGDVVSAMKKNPGQSLIAALAVGVGLGALLCRKRG